MLNIQGCISYYTQAREKHDQILEILFSKNTKIENNRKTIHPNENKKAKLTILNHLGFKKNYLMRQKTRS